MLSSRVLSWRQVRDGIESEAGDYQEGTMNLGSTGSNILERGKVSVEKTWWTSGCCKEPKKSWKSPRAGRAVGKEGSSHSGRQL